MIDNFDGKFEYLANDGRKFYFLSNLAAPRNRIVRCAGWAAVK